MTDDTAGTGRRLRLWHFFALVVVYVALAQALTLAASNGGESAELTSVDALVTRLVVPVGIGAMVALAFVSWLGAWQTIFVERPRLPRLALFVPVVLLVLALVVTHYTGLAEKGFTFTALFLVATMMVGFGEELVFRGVGVQAFRQHGFSEPKVALWTSVVFGVSHGSNAIVTGEIGDALVQVVLTTGTGFVFYLVMRSTGLLTVAMLAHGLWDFSALSTQVDPSDPSPLVNLAAAVLALLLVAVLVLRRRIGLTAPATSAPVTSAG